VSPRSSRANRLPGSDELFRPTGSEAGERPAVAEVAPITPELRAVEPAGASAEPVGERRPSGRQRHDEKITVYVSADELLDLEQARLTLKRDHGLKVDRGRIVRAALADALGDLDANADEARLVRRLREG
jgi:hypothetical protein